MYVKQGVLIGSMLLMNIFLASMTCFASEVTIVFKEEKGALLATSSVSVIKADSVSDGDSLRITGQLKRAHRLPMAGHLHAYTYSESGELIADSKHRVSGLNSNRKGMMRVPFHILFDEVSTGTSQVFLEYHSLGYQES